MNWWQRLRARRALESQLQKELRFHVDQHTNDLVTGGLDPVEARLDERAGRTHQGAADEHRAPGAEHTRHRDAGAGRGALPTCDATTAGCG